MTNQPFLATIKGIPALPYVNVRTGPGTKHDKAFQADVGESGLTVLEAAPDAEGKNLNGKVYQWLRLTFKNNKTGWVRDDLIAVEGDGSALGYGIVKSLTLAHDLVRKDVIAPGQETARPTDAAAPSPKKETKSPAKPEAQAAPKTQPKSKSAPPKKDETAATLMSMGQSGVNVRPGPGTGYNPPLFRFPYKEKARIIDTAPGEGDPFTWIKIDYQGQQGWVREDYMRLISGFESFGLGDEEAYPAPVRNNWWVRDFNLDKSFTYEHWGWDFGAQVGEPVLAGPKGGLVMTVADCQKCGPSGRSSYPGIPLSDSRVLNDPGWNYGYGHYVIMRYLNDQLPKSTQQILAQKGLEGAHLYVMHAHLSRYVVQQDQEVQGGEEIGKVGNSGNSETAHLHLEVRASKNPNDRNWAGMRPNLMSPVVLFLR